MIYIKANGKIKMQIVKDLLEKGYLVSADLVQSFKELDLSNDTLSKLIINLLDLKPPKLISKDFFIKNIDNILSGISNEEIKAFLDKLSKDKIESPLKISEIRSIQDPLIIEEYPINVKKIAVDDFVRYFRNRFLFFKRILQERELENLTSIGKIYGQRKNISIIGIVYEKRITKNKNIILEMEDLTGKISVLIKNDKEELLREAEQIVLDETIAVTGSGNSEIIYANNIFFPEITIKEKKKSNQEGFALFTADLHVGSNKFLEDNFLRFLDWINGKIGNEKQIELAKKIKYLYIAGDLIDGVGIFPGQDRELIIKDVYDQYKKVAELLGKIRKDIKIIICPGNHDSVRIVEPQPHFDKNFSAPLYKLDNVIITTNPSYTRIAQTEDFPGYNVLMYHGYSFDYYANDIDYLRLNKAMANPDLILKFLLRKRHLAPTHTSTTYFPTEEDFLAIRKIPDILITAHIHKSAIASYNGVLTVSCSCWQSRTNYQEKFGHEPDPCKVPILNLQNGKINILDFS